MVAAITFLQDAHDAADLTTYTFASQNLGTASSDRYILVAVNSRALGATAFNASTVTVQGISATQIVNASSTSTNSTMAAIWRAAVPTGTTGDVVVTLNKSALRCSVALYSATGIDAAANDTDTSTANPGAVSIDIPADGFAVACNAAGTTTTFATWTNLTEDYEQLTEGYKSTSASDGFASTQTGLAVSCEWSGTVTEPATAIASWGPSIGGGGLSIPVAFNHYQKLRRA